MSFDIGNLNPFDMGMSILDTGLDWWSTKKGNEVVRDSWAVNSAEALKQREWAAEQAGIQRDWQQDMSNTAVSRRMEDMRKAGINPILAGKFDASTPAGAMPSGASASASAAGVKKMENPRLASSLADIRVKNKQADLIREQAAKTKKETEFVGKKTDIAGPAAEAMAAILEYMKYLGTTRHSAANLNYLINQSKKAGDIRKKPGIEVTPHTEKHRKEGELNRKGYKQTRRGRRRK